MYDPVDSSGMPLRIADSAPRFAGDYTQLVNFLESVEQLAQPLGLSDKDHQPPSKRPLPATPPQPECAQEQPEVEAIAPIPESKKPPRDITAPTSVQLEAHIISAPQTRSMRANHRPNPPRSASGGDYTATTIPEANNAPLSDQVMSPETPSVVDTSVLIALSALSDHPQVQYPCTIPLPVSDDFKHLSVVRDDSKHPSHLNAPVAESSAVPEAQNTPPSDQSISLVTPSVTDHSAHSALSAYSDYRLPVKHPCITSPIRQLDHVLHDSDAPPARRHTPEVAQWDLVWTWFGSLPDHLASPYTPADILDMDIIAHSPPCVFLAHLHFAHSSPHTPSQIRTSHISRAAFPRLMRRIHTILALSSHFVHTSICDAFSRFSNTFPRSRASCISHASSHLVALSSTHIILDDHHVPISPTLLEILTRRALSGDTQYSKSLGDVETRVSAGTYGLILRILTTGLHGTTRTIIHYDFPIERTTFPAERAIGTTLSRTTRSIPACALSSRLSALCRTASRSIHPSSNQSLGMSLFVI
ncbi:hypothetical protein DFJ58DRAFT_735711 [Suillus subalutaceus]|uniref:uncharacterized protein n=1 Tax=Suillus subalutaceus TaxID=48586 RepID=UPI001B87B6AC|nr:uncharacterized protein DFJ58DRAFT_735711 [Suillus subalutaceus]KAG1834930.1 hypothetical protein DFJ58DRAFT_735711 [Suillus subalutaceus]